MSAIEACDSLLTSGDAWNRYRKTTSGFIDLTFADLKGADLRDRVLDYCDFSGAQLQGANLDRARIESSLFTGANLTEISLVDCKMKDVGLRSALLRSSVVRNSYLERVDFGESNLASTIFAELELVDCTISNIHTDGLSLDSCKCVECHFDNFTVQHMRITGCMLRECSLNDWTVANLSIHDTQIKRSEICRITADSGSVKSSDFIECSIEEFCGGGHIIICEKLNFSGSTIVRTNLALVGLTTATMLRTAIAFCEWPQQKGRITSTGKYVPSEHLLAQPVQDVLGIDPLLRREIADAQYLLLKTKSLKKLNLLLMQVWGLCTGFGQSLARLFVSSSILVALSTLAVLAVRGQLFGGKPHPEFLGEAARQSFDAFFALTEIPKAVGQLETTVLILVHICGFLMLGFWVALISTKLSRLSSE